MLCLRNLCNMNVSDYIVVRKSYNLLIVFRSGINHKIYRNHIHVLYIEHYIKSKNCKTVLQDTI